MDAQGAFTVTSFTPTSSTDVLASITTGVTTGHAHLVKEFTGAITGRSVTQFSYCYDDASGIGSYVATESFEGTVDGRTGTFNFIHSATDRGDGVRSDELFVIVPGSGTAELAGIRGTGALVADGDDHRVRLDYSIGT